MLTGVFMFRITPIKPHFRAEWSLRTRDFNFYWVISVVSICTDWQGLPCSNELQLQIKFVGINGENLWIEIKKQGREPLDFNETDTDRGYHNAYYISSVHLTAAVDDSLTTDESKFRNSPQLNDIYNHFLYLVLKSSLIACQDNY